MVVAGGKETARRTTTWAAHTFPKIVCLFLSQSHESSVKKNWLRFVLGAFSFAIASCHTRVGVGSWKGASYERNSSPARGD